MRNVVCICNFLRASGSHQQATQLAESVLIRLHSTSLQHWQEERKETVEVLIALQALLIYLPVVQFLETGDADQRMRVLTAAAEAGLAFDAPSLAKLAQCLLHENMPEDTARMHVSKKTALCSNFQKGQCKFGAVCHFAHGRHELQLCNKWISGTCKYGKQCRYRHGEMESLLTRVLIEAVVSKTPQCTRTRNANKNSRMTIYLLDIFRSGSSSVGPVQQVFDRLVLSLNDRTSNSTTNIVATATTAQSTPNLVSRSREILFQKDSTGKSDNFEENTQKKKDLTKNEEFEAVLKMSVAYFATITGLDLEEAVLSTFAQTESVEQRIRVLRAMHEGRISFEFGSFDNLELEQHNEPMLLEVMVELNLVSDSLVDWFLSKPHLVTEGVWPMRNVVCICNFLRASGSLERATQLAETVLIRLHSTSFRSEERAETIEALVSLQASMTHLPVVQFLEIGNADKRMRVLASVANAGLVFGTQSLVKLAQCLLKSQKTEPCTNFTKGHCKYGAACRLAHGKHETVCKKWINGTCTRGKECCYQHIEMDSLLARVWIEEVDLKLRGGDMLDKLHWKG